MQLDLLGFYQGYELSQTELSYLGYGMSWIRVIFGTSCLEVIRLIRNIIDSS